MTDRIIEERSFKRLVVIIFGIFVFFGIASAIFLYTNLHVPLIPHYGAAHTVVTEVKDSLIIETLKVNLILYLLITLGVLVLGIFYSHRIAGPLLRVKQYAASLALGSFDDRIRFRKKDAVHALASVLNEMAKGCEERINEFVTELTMLEDSLLALDSLSEKSEENEAIIKKLQEVDAKIKVNNQRIRL